MSRGLGDVYKRQLQSFGRGSDSRSRSIFALDEACPGDVTGFSVGTEGAERKVRCFFYLNRPFVFRRLQSRSAAVRRIMNFGIGIEAGYLYGSFTDKSIVAMEAFQVGDAIIDTHDVEAFELVCHALCKVIPVLL